MNPKISTTITRRISLVVSKHELLHCLTSGDACGIVIPPRASVFIRIPSGGDYSGHDLEIEEIIIEWEEIEVK